MVRVACMLLGSLAIMGFAQSRADARTWSVEKGGRGDTAVIQDALDAAAEGDTIRIGPGRYDDFQLFDWTPSGETYVIVGVHQSDLTLIGGDSSQVIIGPESLVEIIDGKEAMGIAVDFFLYGIHCEGLTIENSRWGVLAAGGLSIRSCRFQYNSSGHLEVKAGTGTSYENCTFTQGGGVAFRGPAGARRNITLKGCTFGPEDGCLFFHDVQNATVERCRFEGNWSALAYVQSTGILRESSFENNWAEHVAVYSGSALQIHDCVFSPNAQVTLRCTAYARMEAHQNIIGGGTASTVLVEQITSQDQVVLTNNDLYNGGGVTVKARGERLDSAVTLDFSNNYWGTTDTAQIDEWILDEHDWDPGYPNRYPVVVYDPIRLRSVPTQGQSVGSLKSRFSGHH